METTKKKKLVFATIATPQRNVEPMDFRIARIIQRKLWDELLNNKRPCVSFGGKTSHLHLTMWTLGLSCGMRYRDMLNFNYEENFDPKTRYISYYENKKMRFGSRKRTIPLTEETVQILMDCIRLKTTDGPYLIRNRWGNPLSRQYAKMSVIRVLERFGVDHPTPCVRMLRKTFAYHLYMSNGSDHKALMLTKAALHHQNVDVTMTYLGMSPTASIVDQRIRESQAL